MGKKVVELNPHMLYYIPGHLKTQEIGKKGGQLNPHMMRYIPDHLQTQGMFDAAVSEDSYPLQYVPDWFVTQGKVRKWRDENDYCDNDDDNDNDDDDEIIEWYEGYQKRKAQRAKIKEKFCPLLGILSVRWNGACQKQKICGSSCF